MELPFNRRAGKWNETVACGFLQARNMALHMTFFLTEKPEGGWEVVQSHTKNQTASRTNQNIVMEEVRTDI